MKNKVNLKQLLNLDYTDYANQTYSVGKYDMPYVYCKSDINPDYLALYSEVRNYQKTSNTCVCFYQFDRQFDGIGGLFNAIYYNNKQLLDFYKERFKNVRYFIAPDYSQCGDVHRIENLYRLFRARLVSIWLVIELGAIVIPNVTYANESYFDVMLDGMENCTTVAFSIKGSMTERTQREILIKAIKYTVDHLKLERIIVYSVSGKDSKVMDIFSYAISKGITIIVPDNVLKIQNMKRGAI